MNRLKFSILAVASAAALSTSAIEPLWLRDVKISPDGTHIAFTYKGDIYKVASSGGDAVRLTTQPSVEANPVWSADSKLIAFASDRFGIWNDDGKGTLTVSFPDANHEPLPQSHMRAEQNVLTFNGVQSSGFVLRLDSPDGHVYTYRLVKW